MPESKSPAEAEATLAHMPALDGVRRIAILMVLVYHFMGAGYGVQNRTTGLVFDQLVNRVVSVGWAGVDLFFVLSGFLITRILLSAREGKGYFRSFYARRFLRIFPAYYGFLFIVIVLLPLLPSFRHNDGLAQLRHHQLVYWTYMFNIAESLYPFSHGGAYNNGHFWSLCVEEQFYLVWPLIVLALGRRRLGVFCVLCIIAAPIFRYALLHGAVPRLHNIFAAATLMPARMDALAIGGLIAVAEGEPGLLRRSVRWVIPVGMLAALFVAALYVGHDPRGGLWMFDEPVQVYGFSAIAIGFAALLTTVVGGPTGRLEALASGQVLRFFGRYSYALYVVHYQIMRWMISLVRDHGNLPVVAGSNVPSALLFTIVGCAISLMVSWLSWHLFEQHFLRLKRFVPYRRQLPAARRRPSPLGLQPDADEV